MRKGQEGVPAFGVILVIGLMIFGLVFIMDAGVSGDLFSTDEVDRKVLFEKSYGKVGSSNPDHRTIELGSFTVGEARGEVTAYRADRREISDKILGKNSVWFEYNATEPTGGTVNFEVLGREGKGEVVVQVNGEKVFSEPLVASSTPEISISKERLEPGMNRFKIGVNSGLVGSSTYAIEDIDVKVNDRKFHGHTDTFQIYSYEMQDYIESPMTFRVAESVKSSPLEIFVNDQRVYSKAQVRSEETVQITPENANLHPGSNSIRFTTDRRPSKYVIEDAGIAMRYLGNVQAPVVEENFQLNNSELNYAKRGDTTEFIRFKYTNLLPSPRPLEVTFNGNSSLYEPANGVNRFDIAQEDITERNSLKITSNGTYELNNLQLISSKVKE